MTDIEIISFLRSIDPELQQAIHSIATQIALGDIPATLQLRSQSCENQDLLDKS